MLPRILLCALLLAGAFAVTTLYALEGREVVVVRTRGDDGEVRETRTWIADDGGYAWIETANLERPFYRDILARPDIEVVRGDSTQAFRAVPLPPPEGHPLIRGLLAQKYGWADWWIGLVADTSSSTAIRLDPR